MPRLLLALLIVATTVATARAAPPPPNTPGPDLQLDARRVALERREATARAANDLDQYAAIGAGYLELYGADPGAPRADELLYNAAAAFRAGGAVTAAAQAFEQLQRLYPRSRLARLAPAHLGALYASVAMYDRAAAKLEAYARMSPGEPDASNALLDATRYRQALGDREQALADTNAAVTLFGARRPRDAADAVWASTALFDDAPDRAVAQLGLYLRTFGANGGPARVVLARARIGQLRWRQSCPVAGVDGLCVSPRPPARAATCAAASGWIVARRAPGARAEARTALTAAIAAFNQHPLTDDPAARHAYAEAKLALADADLEAVLADRAPTASTKGLAAWSAGLHQRAAALTSAYEAVRSVGDPPTAITASARLGVLAHGLALALVDPTPAPGGSPPTCDNVTALEDLARDAYKACLASASNLGWYDASFALCDHALAELSPAAFPPLRELHAAPRFDAPALAVESPAVRGP
jgi:tetratricopeptide (TPR) repeat protein